MILMTIIVVLLSFRSEYYVYKNGSHINCVFRKSNGNQLIKELIPRIARKVSKLNKKGFSQKRYDDLLKLIHE